MRFGEVVRETVRDARRFIRLAERAGASRADLRAGLRLRTEIQAAPLDTLERFHPIDFAYGVSVALKLTALEYAFSGIKIGDPESKVALGHLHSAALEIIERGGDLSSFGEFLKSGESPAINPDAHASANLLAESLFGTAGRLAGSPIRKLILEVLTDTTKPRAMFFAGGVPKESTFPFHAILASFFLGLADFEVKGSKGGTENPLQYGSTPGMIRLRKFFAWWAREKEGVRNVDHDNVVMTTGGQQGLDLVARILVDKGDIVIIDDPSYLGMTGVLNSVGAKIERIPLDPKAGVDTTALRQKLESLREQGAILSDAEFDRIQSGEKVTTSGKLKFMYVITDSQNPGGVNTPTESRIELIKLAKEFHFFLVDDRPYAELQFPEKEEIGEDGVVKTYVKPQALGSLDDSGIVISLYTLSKYFAPGLRIGAVLGPKAIMRQLGILLQYAELHSSTLTQSMALAWLERYELGDQIKLNSEAYRSQRDAMIEALNEHFPATSKIGKDSVWTRPTGGLFVWGQLPNNIVLDEAVMVQIFKKYRVAAVPGWPAFSENNHTVRLCFAKEAPADIKEGIKRFAMAMQELDQYGNLDSVDVKFDGDKIVG